MSVDRGTIVAATRRYVLDNFLYTKPDAQLDDDERLLERGIVDSMGVMELIAFVQEQYGITVAEAEITEQHFGSLAAIASYVASKRRPG